MTIFKCETGFGCFFFHHPLSDKEGNQPVGLPLLSGFNNNLNPDLFRINSPTSRFVSRNIGRFDEFPLISACRYKPS
jgi:hypothetical protein